MRAFRSSIVGDPDAIDPAAWDALVAADPDSNPFLSHAYLHALHASGCASESTGWAPCFLLLHEGAHLAAAVPLWRKSHSYGEYVFDWAWAEALHRVGRPYYPKTVAAIPFTPVAGSRLLAASDAARDAAGEALAGFAREQAGSSLHVLFPPPAQAQALARSGWLLREGVQFHWVNRGYRDFEDFLGALAQPKRKKIRAERRKVREAGVELERRAGGAIAAADWDFFVRCYENTYAEHGAPPYLDAGFFARVAQAMPEHFVLVIARREGRPVASALGVLDAARGALYGRYWGALEPVACLHFECCYYQMIDFAIERRLAVFEGGAQGAHKLARGLDPVPTLSAHWIRDPALRDAVARFLANEREAVGAAIDELAEHRAFRRD